MYKPILGSGGDSNAVLLWEGDYSTGSINVPGLSDYCLVGYCNDPNSDVYMAIGTPTRGGSSYGSYQSNTTAYWSYRLALSGDTLSCDDYNRGIYWLGNTTYTNPTNANTHIYKIYGLIKKPGA